MNYCEQFDAAGVVSGTFLVTRDGINADSIRKLIDSLDDTIKGASVQFRPMTDEEINNWRVEMAERQEAANKIAGDTESVKVGTVTDAGIETN